MGGRITELAACVELGFKLDKLRRRGIHPALYFCDEFTGISLE
jgi:hypothetical protein